MKRILLVILVLLINEKLFAQSFGWAKSMGGNGTDVGYDIATDATGNVFSVGVFEGTVDFDPGSGVFTMNTNGSSANTFIQKLDANGKLVWAKQITGTSNRGCSIVLDPNGDVYFAGTFSGSIDADPGSATLSFSSGSSSVLVEKLDNSGNFLWAKEIETHLLGSPALAIDTGKNLIVGGYFKLTTDFDPGSGVFNISASGQYDAFLEKLSNTGAFIWAKALGRPGGEAEIKSIAVDKSNNILSTGWFDSTVDFDPGIGVANLSSQGQEEVFALKLDANGDYVWVRQLSGTMANVGTSIAIDNINNIYLTGYFYGTVDFDPGPVTINITSNGGRDVFVEKLSSVGNYLWAKQIGSTADDDAGKLAIDNNGSVYTTGMFQLTADFDPNAAVYNMTAKGSPTTNGPNTFIQKLSSGGGFQWANQIRETELNTFGAAGYNYGFAITVTSPDNVLTTGFFQGTADFDPGPDSFKLTQVGWPSNFYNYPDIFIQKLSPSSTISFATTTNPTLGDKIIWQVSTGQIVNPIKICADGSQATKLSFINRTGIASGKIRFWIESDTAGLNSYTSGYFLKYSIHSAITGDTLVAELAHPKYLAGSAGLFRLDNIRVVDTSNSFPNIYTIPIQIYRAPVLMVHGLWGSKEAFDSMEVRLQRSNYPAELTYRAGYEETNDRSFYDNRSEIRIGIDETLQRCIDGGYSSAKVDLICHSMGGLLARQYIQSNYYAYDVHKLITLNTPHAGSQSANFLLNPGFILLRLSLAAIGNSCTNGAVKDLKVFSPGNAIDVLANGLNYNHYNDIGVHAISSSTIYPTSVPNTEIAGLYLQSKAAGYGENVPAFLSHLFGEDNDCVVAVSSQQGGLSSVNYSFISWQYHRSCRNPNYQIEIDWLLAADPVSSVFVHNGFVPPTLSSLYKFSNSETNAEHTAGTGTITITAPANNSVISPGQTVNVSVITSGAVNRIALLIGNQTIGVHSLDTVATSGTFSIVVPPNAIGPVKLLAVGWNDSGLVALDTIAITANLTSGLDSLHFYPNEAALPAKGRLFGLVTGYFNDGVMRNISKMSNVHYEIADTNIAVRLVDNIFYGKQLGRTTMKVSYLGDTVLVPIVVFPADPNFPPTDVTSPKTPGSNNLGLPLTVFPNPNKGDFIVQLPTFAGENIILEVFDQFGRTVYSQIVKCKNSTLQQRVSFQSSPGLYYIQATTMARVYANKIVVAH
jgi:hypothetical protein